MEKHFVCMVMGQDETSTYKTNQATSQWLISGLLFGGMDSIQQFSITGKTKQNVLQCNSLQAQKCCFSYFYLNLQIWYIITV